MIGKRRRSHTAGAGVFGKRVCITGKMRGIIDCGVDSCPQRADNAGREGEMKRIHADGAISKAFAVTGFADTIGIED